MRKWTFILGLALLAAAPLLAQYGDISDVKLAKPEDKEDVKGTPPPRAQGRSGRGTASQGCGSRGAPTSAGCPSSGKLRLCGGGNRSSFLACCRLPTTPARSPKRGSPLVRKMT